MTHITELQVRKDNLGQSRIAERKAPPLIPLVLEAVTDMAYPVVAAGVRVVGAILASK